MVTVRETPCQSGRWPGEVNELGGKIMGLIEGKAGTGHFPTCPLGKVARVMGQIPALKSLVPPKCELYL